LSCAGYEWVRFYFAYERGGADGAITFQYEISPYSSDQSEKTDWIAQTVYAPAPLSPCEDVCSEVQNETITYCATSDAVETFSSPPIHLAGCVERIRVACQESGNIGAPGDAQVIAVFYSEG
jgi:hypothetical protein